MASRRQSAVRRRREEIDPLFVAAACPVALADTTARYAWFRATAPVEDVKFLGRYSRLVRAEAAWLLRHMRVVTKDHARQLRLLNRLRSRDAELQRPLTPSWWPIHTTAQEISSMTNKPKSPRSSVTPFPPVAPAPVAASAPPVASGRAGVDWVAAGRKAYETRLRNQAARLAGRPVTTIEEAQAIVAGANGRAPAAAPVAVPPPVAPAPPAPVPVAPAQAEARRRRVAVKASLAKVRAAKAPPVAKTKASRRKAAPKARGERGRK